uniref:NADH-ubiquinone oxidoreductase chain 2 n=1 Tax=Chordodes sp. VVA-2019 TaxID=2586751 RepID=A0A514ABV3_9BILA|nr:NADH dehydrogenase subunit 2 [Chordodes sp. VVA-2019]
MFIFGLLMLMNTNDYFSLWVFLTINLVTFLLLCLNEYSNYKLNLASFYYMIIQSVLSMFMLIFYILFSYSYSLFMLLLFIFKSGIFPSHNWYVNVSKMCSWKMFWMVSTIQKFYPLWFVVTLLYDYNINMFNNTEIMIFSSLVLLNMLMGAMAPINMFNNTEIMIFSSLGMSSWLILSSLLGDLFYMFYYFLYLLIFYVIMSKLMKFNLLMSLKYLAVTAKYFKDMSKLNFMMILVISGYPISIMFLYKIMILYNLFSYNMLILTMVVMMMSTVNYFNYFKFMALKMININYFKSYNYFNYFKFMIINMLGCFILMKLIN